MSSNYPGTLDNFTNPAPTDYEDVVSHSGQHSGVNDATEAIEGVLGTTAGSAVLKDFTAGQYPVRHSGGTLADTIVGGTLNNVSLGTAVITSPTIRAYSGWQDANETWTYSSVDDPTGVFTVSGDVTSKYSVGMRIKFTNGGNTIYGIITALSYSSPNTTITFLHEIDPTDSQALYLMANSAITANYYSTQKAPFGFPLNPDKWSVKANNNTDIPLSTTKNSIQTTGLSIVLPIGLWKVRHRESIQIAATSTTYVWFRMSLSTANNTESDKYLIWRHGFTVSSGNIDINATGDAAKLLSIASKTTYYLNAYGSTGAASMSSFVIYGLSATPTILEAVCAYL